MSESDDLFTREDPVFLNKELLEISHLPAEGRIVGRDDEISQLANAVNPGIFGQSPSNVLIYGKTGTGKSLCAKYVSRRLVDTADDEGVAAAYAYVDCAQDSTETQTVQTIASSLNDDDTDVYIPDKGISTATYYKRLWRILDDRYDVILVILDEIDKLEDDDILMQLSRAGEAGKLTSCKVGVVGISNKIKYKDRMDERVKSSLCEREFVFPPYDAGQLNDIMTARSDAFRDGVLEDGVIPKAAALAAREHGDARKAIDILRYAGEIAQSEGAPSVREEFVRQARQRAETDRFRELIRGSTPHSRYVLQALTILSVDTDDDGAENEGFRTTRIYEVYEQICRQVGSEPLSLRRVRDLLKEHAFLDVVEQSRHSGGSAEGSYTEHTLLEDPTVVKDVLSDTID
jgi:cell division control protein 6